MINTLLRLLSKYFKFSLIFEKLIKLKYINPYSEILNKKEISIYNH